MGTPWFLYMNTNWLYTVVGFRVIFQCVHPGIRIVFEAFTVSVELRTSVTIWVCVLRQKMWDVSRTASKDGPLRAYCCRDSGAVPSVAVLFPNYLCPWWLWLLQKGSLVRARRAPGVVEELRREQSSGVGPCSVPGSHLYSCCEASGRFKGHCVPAKTVLVWLTRNGVEKW